jgi:hypothetical protein
MSAYYLYTGQTQAQTQIDTNHTTAWLLTAASPWTLGGGRFVMKRGTATTGDISLVVRTGSSSGTEIARVTLSRASFTGSFTEVAFDFSSPLALQAGTSYYIAIESSAPDVQSEAYFIKGVRETTIEDLTRTPLSPSAYQVNFGGAAPGQTGIDAISDDTGPSATDFITGAASQTVFATLDAALQSGDVLWGSVDNGSTWTDISGSANGTSVTWTGVTLNSGTDTLQIKIERSGGSVTVLQQAYTLDAVAPTQAITIDSITTDSGTPADFITNTAAQTVSATLDAQLQGDEALYASLDNGATWTDVTSNVSGTSVSWSGVTLNGGVDGSNTLLFVIRDTAGNEGKTANQAYTLDRATPAQSVFIDSISLDSGTAGDFITNTATQTIAGHLSAKLGTGDVLEGSLDNGATWTNVTAHVSGTTISWTGTTLNAGQDGSNTLRLRVSDRAGNTGASDDQGYTLDTTAPSQSLTIVQLSNDTGTAGDFITSGPGQTITVTLGATLAADERLEGSLDNGTTWSDITAKVSGTDVSWSGTTLNGGVDGSNTLRLRLLDRAGNTGTKATQAYTLDRMAPAQTISITGLSTDTGKAGDFITRTAVQTISGTLSTALDSGDVLLGSLDNGATWTDITAKVSGTTINWGGATLNDGTSAIRLRLTDQAGNVGNSASRAYRLDTTPPPVPGDFDIATATDTGANDLTTAHNLPVIGFTSEAGLTITLTGPAGGVLTHGAAGHYRLATSGARYIASLIDARPAQAGRQLFGTFAGGKATGNAEDIADGTYTFTGTDLAGNQSTLGSFVIDTTAPTAPTDLDISAATDTGANDLRTWNGLPVLTFTAESGLNVVLKGASGTTLTRGPAAQYSMTEAAQGGGRSLYMVTLLDADPARTGSQPYGTFAAGAATRNAPNVADGTYTLTGSDSAGNSTSLGSFMIATSPAQPRVTQLPKNRAAIGLTQRLSGLSCDDITRSAVVSGTAEPNANLRLFDMAGLPSVNSTPVATLTADGAGRWSATLPALSQGLHHIVAQQVDANGTVGGYGFYDFIYDTRAPVVTEMLARNAAGRISQVSGTGEAGLRVELSNGTATIGTATVGMTGKWSFLPPPSIAASSGLIAAQIDFAGNLGVAVAGSGMTYTVPAGRNVAVYNTGANTVVKLGAAAADITLDLGTDPGWRLDLIGLGSTFANANAVRSALVAAGSGSMLTLPSGGTVQFMNLPPSSPLFDSTHLRLV